MSTDRTSLVRLRLEVARDLDAAAALLAPLSERAEALRGVADPVLLGYAAITLHQVYTAVETAFERVCRTLEGSLPTGRDSHHALLQNMTFDLPGVRPAVLTRETASELQHLLRFRHFVRHAYAIAWDPERITEILATTRRFWPALDAEVRAFLAFLDGVAAQGGT